MIHHAPQSVAIVAMGASNATYLERVSLAGDRRRFVDETWAINVMGSTIQHDLLFQMDDLAIQCARAREYPESGVAGMVGWLKEHPRFFTSRAYPEFPGAVEFPLKDVADDLGIVYFNNTAAYAVAWAIHCKVKQIWMFGCDYSYPDRHKAEAGRGCVEMLLGIAHARGIKVSVPPTSSLCDANVPKTQKPYGYDSEDLDISVGPDGFVIDRTPRETLPTAAEITSRYHPELRVVGESG